jgi:uncharacterized protein (TIGR02246 family)
MSDEQAIQQLINRYTDGCNRRDWDEVLATFAPDGVWEAGGAVVTGHSEIRAAMAGFLTRMEYFVQTASASVIAVHGDKASARTTIREGGKFAGRDEAVEVFGWYEDSIARTAAGWQFTHRKFRTYGMHKFALLPGPALG